MENLGKAPPRQGQEASCENPCPDLLVPSLPSRVKCEVGLAVNYFRNLSSGLEKGGAQERGSCSDLPHPRPQGAFCEPAEAREVRQGQDWIAGGIGSGIRGGVQVAPRSLRLRGVVQVPRLRGEQLLGTEEEEGVELLCGCQLSCQPTATGLIRCP